MTYPLSSSNGCNVTQNLCFRIRSQSAGSWTFRPTNIGEIVNERFPYSNELNVCHLNFFFFFMLARKTHRNMIAWHPELFHVLKNLNNTKNACKSSNALILQYTLSSNFMNYLNSLITMIIDWKHSSIEKKCQNKQDCLMSRAMELRQFSSIDISICKKVLHEI